MKLLIVILLILAMAGCSTLRLSSTATQAERDYAHCSDARLGLAMAEIALDGVLGKDATIYWERFRAGALLAVATRCEEPK